MPDEDAPEEHEPDDADFVDDDLEEEADEAEEAGAELIARLVYEVPLQRRKEQREDNQTLDNRLSTTRTVSAGMVALLAAAFVLAGDSANEVLAHGEVRASVITTAALFIATFSASFVPYLTQADVGSPWMDDFMASAREMAPISLMWALGEAIAIATELNQPRLKRKALWVNIATALATLTGISIAVTVILAVAAAGSST